NTARAFAIFCDGISVMTVSSGWGDVSAGCGGGGLAGVGVTRARWSPDGGSGAIAWPAPAGGAVIAPGGGGNGCAWMDCGFPGEAGYGPGNCTGGGCWGNDPLGISAGGRGGKPPHLVCASTGPAASVPPSTASRTAIRSMEPGARSGLTRYRVRPVNMPNAAKPGCGYRPPGVQAL